MFARLLIPFSSRNYRLYFTGQLISLIGSWMTQTATVWLVVTLTNSPFWLGVVGFLTQAPIILLGPFAGVWVDRLDRMRLLIATQALAMVQSLTLAALALTGNINMTSLCLLAVFQGLINAMDMPVRQSLSVLLVEKREHLAAMIGMNASMFNLARLAGPAIGGVVLAKFGAGYCFLIDGLSYIAVLGALMAMSVTAPHAERTGRSVVSEMKEGFAAALGFRPVRTLIMLSGGMSTFGFSFAVLMPLYARDIFKGDGMTLGILMSSSAAGAVLAALYLASRQRMKGIGLVICGGATLAGLGLWGFAFSRIFPLSMLALLAVGMGSVLVMASCNTLVQNMVDEGMRGRVMAIYSMVFLGGMPLGSLMTGSLATHWGVPAATFFNGAACIVLAALFYRQLPTLRVEARAAMERTGAIAPLTPAPAAAENIAG